MTMTFGISEGEDEEHQATAGDDDGDSDWKSRRLYAGGG